MALTDYLPDNSVGNAINTKIQGAGVSRYNPVNMITNGRNFLDAKANKYLVKPKTAEGIGGFLFDYEVQTDVVLQAEITEHYTEKNTFVMDHIAQRPIRISLRGLVGEKVLTHPSGVVGALANIQSKLTTLPAMLGKYTPGAVQKLARAVTKAQDTVTKIDNYIHRAQNLVGLFAGSTPGPTRQHRAFMDLYGLWTSRAVFTVNTPFKYFDSMVIEQLSFIQEEDTKYISDICVTLKEIRFAGVDSSKGQSTTDALQTNDGRAAYQRQGQTNKGRTVGTQTALSTLKSAFGLA